MRNLTITRQKSFVGCLGTMKVYIEDAAQGSLAIKVYVKDEATGQPVQKEILCRKLGTLKNGEQKTFQVDNGAAKVIVIADQLSKNYCNEYYELPEGEEDVALTGKNHFNPAAGNPFQFEGITNEVILQNRKKGTKKGLVVLCIAAVVGFILGFVITSTLLPGDGDPKNFSSGGMTVTLTDEFIKQNQPNYTVCYGSKDVAVLALKEEFSLLEGLESYSVKQYGNLVMQATGTSTELKTVDELTYFVYNRTNSEIDTTFSYFTFLYKANDAFWAIQFAVKKEEAEAYQNQIFEWASSVTFK